MSDQTNFPQTVNANQNNVHSWVSRHPEYIQYIPIANWLIEKHCSQWWKNHPNTYEYYYCHFGICLELACPVASRGFKLEGVALNLRCHVLDLLNDSSPEMQQIT